MFDAVKKLLSTNYGVDPEKITLDTHLSNELGFSGESMEDFIMDVEDYFEIEVDEDDFSKLETISDLVDYIEEYQNLTVITLFLKQNAYKKPDIFMTYT